MMKLAFLLFIFLSSLPLLILTASTENEIVELSASDDQIFEPRNEQEMDTAPGAQIEASDGTSDDEEDDQLTLGSLMLPPTEDGDDAAEDADAAAQSSSQMADDIGKISRWKQVRKKLRPILRPIFAMRGKQNYVRNLYKPDKYNLPKVWGGVVKRTDQPIDNDEADDDEEEGEEEDQPRDDSSKQQQRERQRGGDKAPQQGQVKKMTAKKGVVDQQQETKDVTKKKTGTTTLSSLLRKSSTSTDASGASPSRTKKAPKAATVSQKGSSRRKRRRAGDNSVRMLHSREKLMTVIMEYVELKLKDMSKQYAMYRQTVENWPLDDVQTVKEAFKNDMDMYQKYAELSTTWPMEVSMSLKQLHLAMLGKLGSNSALVKSFLGKVQKWSDKVTTVEAAFGKDKKSFDVYMQNKDIWTKLEKDVKRERWIKLKESHLNNLTEMANKFNEFKQVVADWPPEGCFMTFPLEKNIFNKVFLFDHALTLSPDDLKNELQTGLFTHAQFVGKKTPNDFFDNPEWSLNLEVEKKKNSEDDEEDDDEEDDDEEEEEDDDDEDEDSAKMAINAILEAILKGPDGFMTEAKLNFRNLPKWDGKQQEDKSIWEIAKGIVRKVVRMVKWPLRAFRIMTKKLTSKARRMLKTKKERELMKKALDEVAEDDVLNKIYKSMAKTKLFFEGRAKHELEKQQKDKNGEADAIDHWAHKQLTNEGAFQHPFTFLQSVRYDIHVKPADTEFNSLYPTQYDELMEFHADPEGFYKNKRLDDDTIYVMRKMFEPNPYLKALKKKQYYLIHEFFADPVQFYLYGNKLDKFMNEALRSINGFVTVRKVVRRGYQLSTGKMEPAAYARHSKTPTVKNAEVLSVLKDPNAYLGNTERLDDVVLETVKKAFNENERPIKKALIRKRIVSRGDLEQEADKLYADLKAFLEAPLTNTNKLNLKVFQTFRDVLVLSNDKFSNEETEQLSTEDYQQFLHFLDEPSEFLNHKKLDDTIIATLQQVFDKRADLFNHLTDKQMVQLKAFKEAISRDNQFNGQLDREIFKKYRQVLPSNAKKRTGQRIKDFFTGTKLRLDSNKFKTERQFDQLMRFLKHPDRFYQQSKIKDANVLQEFCAVLKRIVAQKRDAPMLANLTEEEYNEFIELAKDPAARFAPRETGTNKNKFDKARGVSPRVSNTYRLKLEQNKSCAMVKPLIELALYGREDRQKASTDLRGRLGAQIISSVLNEKRFTMGIPLVASLIGSGGIAVALDIGVFHLIVHHVGLAIGATNPVTIILLIMLQSLTPLAAETFDSFVIKRALGAMQGNSFLPRTWKQFKRDLMDAGLSGSIAAIGSIANNIVSSLLPGSKYLAGGAHNVGGWFGVFTLNAFTNQIAASTSGAMVPVLAERWHKYRSAAMFKLINTGFFPMPIKEELAMKMVTAKTVAGYCRLRAMDAMHIDSVTAMAFNSMGIGAVISFFFGFTAIFIPVSMGILEETWQNIVSIMFNTPTEVLSLGMGQLTARHLGNQSIQKWMSTDYHKNKQMVGLIFEKAIEQLEDNKRELKRIDFEDVYKIYHTRFQWTYKLGKGITHLMVGIKNGLVKLTSKRPIMIDQVDEQYISKEILVQNWRPNVAYLVQFPRTNSALSLSPSAIKLETWLKMKNIPFYTISDGVLFRALFDEQVPFVEYNGQKIFGTTEEIIDTLQSEVTTKGQLGEMLRIKSRPAQIEIQMRNLIETVLYSLLLHDRLQNLADRQSPKCLANKIDFQQMVMPMLLKKASRNWFKEQPLPKPFWDEFFADKSNPSVKYGEKSWNGAGIGQKKWNEFVKKVHTNDMPKALSKFVDYLKKQAENQLNNTTSSSAPGISAADDNQQQQLLINDRPQLFVRTMEQIEQHLLNMREQRKNQKEKKFFLFGKEPKPLDAFLFGILLQFHDRETIYNDRYADYLGTKLADQTSPLREHFAQMDAIFGSGIMADGPRKRWPINAQWAFNANALHYDGPFVLRFDGLKLSYEDRMRFTEQQLKTFTLFLPDNEDGNENGNGSGIVGGGTMFVGKTKLLALYPKVVTFITHQLLRFLNLERFVIELAELPTIVEVQSLEDYFTFLPAQYGHEIQNKIEKFGKMKKGILPENKNMQMGRAVVHLMASYLCEGNIESVDCADVHNDQAKTFLSSVLEFSEQMFLELTLIVRQLVHQMMGTVNDEYQATEALKKFGAALLEIDDEQSIKHEASRLRNAIWELEQFENGKIAYLKSYRDQLKILLEEIQTNEPTTREDAPPDACSGGCDPLITERIKNVRQAKKRIENNKNPALYKYDPKEMLTTQEERTNQQIKDVTHTLGVWVLRQFIVAEMRALVDELDNDVTLAKNRITFADFMPSRNHWLSLNGLYAKCIKVDKACMLDREQMKLGHRQISERKKKHVLKELWAKVADQHQGVYSEKQYHDVFSYRLGQVRKLYELRKSQLPKKLAVNMDEANEQHMKMWHELLQQLGEAEVTTSLDDDQNMELVETLSEITFTSKKQDIGTYAENMKKSIQKMNIFVENQIDELKRMPSDQPKDEMEEKVNAVVHRKYLLQEMSKLIDMLDNQKFQQNVYPFEYFKEAYFSGELFIVLHKQVVQDGTKFDEDEMNNGSKYVKGYSSMHRIRRLRAFLFDRTGKIVEEKKFVKKLAWRIGQLTKLYQLRQQNIAEVEDTKKWTAKKKMLKAEGDAKWEEIKAQMNKETKAIMEAATGQSKRGPFSKSTKAGSDDDENDEYANVVNAMALEKIEVSSGRPGASAARIDEL